MEKILIADSNPLIREGLSNIILQLRPKCKITFVENMDQFYRVSKSEKYFLIITDIVSPFTNMLSEIRRIIEKDPAIKIVVYSKQPEEVFGRLLIGAGCKSYVCKSYHNDVLISALQHAIVGKTWLPEPLTDMITSNIVVNPNFIENPFQILTVREHQVVGLILAGKSNSSICDSIGLRQSTIATYKRRLMNKLGVLNIIQLYELAKLYRMIA